MLKTIGKRGSCALAVALLVGFPAVAQESGDQMQKEIDALKQGQNEIKQQLAEIKRLLQTQQRPQPPARKGPEVEGHVFDISKAQTKGDKSASLTLIEFTDYQ